MIVDLDKADLDRADLDKADLDKMVCEVNCCYHCEITGCCLQVVAT